MEKTKQILPSTVFLIYLGTILSLLDGVFTTIAVKLHFAKEINPFMAFFIDISSWLFLLVKVVLTAFSFYMFFKLLNYSLIRKMAIFYSVLYTVITIWHIIGFSIAFVLRDMI